jgi:hypothetical protein
MAKNAAAKLKKSLGVKDCDDLLNLMDQQDAKQDADDSSPLDGRSKGVPCFEFLRTDRCIYDIQSFGFSLSMEKVRVKVLDSIHLARPGLNYEVALGQS